MTTISKLKKMKESKEIFSSLVLYDYTFANFAVNNGIDVLVVGDSAGMSLLGAKTTVPTTMDMMIYHTKAVVNGAQNNFVVADLPYGSYLTHNEAIQNAAKLMQAGASMVKLEGDKKWTVETVSLLVERGIPICAHIGLTPQYYHQLGGYKTAGKTDNEQERIYNAALALDKAGADMIVLECVPESLGERITNNVKALTLGAGAGKHCNGQVLLMYDLIGLTGKQIKFSKNFLEEANSIAEAITKFSNEVKAGSFPTKDHIYS